MPETLRPPIEAQVNQNRQDITKTMLQVGVIIADSRRKTEGLIARTTYDLTNQMLRLAGRVTALEEDQDVDAEQRITDLTERITALEETP